MIVVTVVDYSSDTLTVIVMFFAVSVSVLGSLGLFAIKRHPDDIKDTRLYLLVMYADCWAAALSLAVMIVGHTHF